MLFNYKIDLNRKKISQLMVNYQIKFTNFAFTYTKNLFKKKKNK